jgi:hypothetical protein
VSLVVITGADGRFVPDVDREELARRAEGEEVSGDLLAWDRVTGALGSLPQPNTAVFSLSAPDNATTRQRGATRLAGT